MEKHIITNSRVKNFLYCMGFNFEQVETDDKVLYLFEKSNLLYDALSFYTNFKKRKIEEDKKVKQQSI